VTTPWKPIRSPLERQRPAKKGPDPFSAFNSPSSAASAQRLLLAVKNTHGSNTITVSFATGSNGAYRIGNSLSSADRDITAGKTKYFGIIYNSDDQRWDVIAVEDVG
jgi:hypothetical protein